MPGLNLFPEAERSLFTKIDHEETAKPFFARTQTTQQRNLAKSQLKQDGKNSSLTISADLYSKEDSSPANGLQQALVEYGAKRDQIKVEDKDPLRKNRDKLLKESNKQLFMLFPPLGAINYIAQGGLSKLYRDSSSYFFPKKEIDNVTIEYQTPTFRDFLLAANRGHLDWNHPFAPFGFAPKPIKVDFTITGATEKLKRIKENAKIHDLLSKLQNPSPFFKPNELVTALKDCRHDDAFVHSSTMKVAHSDKMQANKLERFIEDIPTSKALAKITGSRDDADRAVTEIHTRELEQDLLAHRDRAWTDRYVQLQDNYRKGLSIKEDVKRLKSDKRFHKDTQWLSTLTDEEIHRIALETAAEGVKTAQNTRDAKIVQRFWTRKRLRNPLELIKRHQPKQEKIEAAKFIARKRDAYLTRQDFLNTRNATILVQRAWRKKKDNGIK